MTRQKLFLGIVGILAVLQGGDWLLTHAIEGPMQLRRRRTALIQKNIEQRKKDLAQTREEGKRLAVWESQSLPANPDVARSLYRDWLLNLIAKIGFSDRHVDAGSPVNHRGLFQSIGFSIRGRGTLTQVTRFLFEFYSANQLHQIQTLNMTPRTGSERLELAISIEALILPTSDRIDRLATGRADWLASTSLADYSPIVERNLFGIETTGIDEAAYAYLTAVTISDGQPEAWFTLRNADKVLKRQRGESIAAGQISATIVEILDADVVIETGGERWLLAIGDNLTQASALPPEH